MTIKATAVSAIKRLYPHVSEIQDPSTSQTVRLLWDRIHDLEERLQAQEATAKTLVSTANTTTTAVTAAQAQSREALAFAQKVGAVAGSTVVGGEPPPVTTSNFPQPYDPIKNPNPTLGRTATYVQDMINAAFAAYKAANPGKQPEASTTYWYTQFLTKNTLDPNGTGDGWGAYWWDRIQASPGVPA